VKPPIGGQAVIEGVMMQNGDRVAVAVRRPDTKAVVIRALPVHRRFPRLGRTPFLRGTFRLYDTMALGMRALNVSTQIAFPEEEISKGGTFFAFAVAIVLGVGIFIVLPLFIAQSVSWLRLGNTIVFNLVEGLIRLAIFFAYLAGIRWLVKDIRRVFRYHGAEHKAIHAYEAGEEVTVENAKKHTTLHPRCGTAFLMTVFVIAILVFSVAGNPALWLKILSRILLLPVVAGLAYEAQRFAGRNFDRLWVRILAQPGLWLQKLTTGEPTDDMIEVAIAALREVRDPDQAQTEMAGQAEGCTQG
jgi:uncharacterized protein YqhQ